MQLGKDILGFLEDRSVRMDPGVAGQMRAIVGSLDGRSSRVRGGRAGPEGFHEEMQRTDAGDPSGGGSDGAAIPDLLATIDGLCTDRRIWFDEHDEFILYTPDQLRRRKEFVETQRALGDAAEILFHAGDWDAAFRLATMAISLEKHLSRGYNGHQEQREPGDGDVGCRLVRACVFIRRSDIDAARQEVREAASVARRPGRGEGR